MALNKNKEGKRIGRNKGWGKYSLMNEDVIEKTEGHNS